MNNCQFRKIILGCLIFPNILIPLNEVNSYQLKNTSINAKNNKSNKGIDFFNSKIYSRSYLLTSIENIQNISEEYKEKETNDQNINTLVNELIIESKIQSEKDNILYAEGEVIVKFKENILKADTLSYNKKTKLAKAKGNIFLKINNQIFQADEVEYDFVKNKGNFRNVKGLINSESII